MKFKLILYVLEGCPYCNAALEAVQQNGIDYHKVIVPLHRKQHYKQQHGMQTFPQIFMEKGKQTWKIGGHDDLMAWLATR